MAHTHIIMMEEPAGAPVIRARITAYCSCTTCCGPGAHNRTASGTRPRRGTVATAWKALPKGTYLRIPGAKGRGLAGDDLFIVEDTGGGMRQSWRLGVFHIDMWHPTHAEALSWGRRFLQVAVFPAGSDPKEIAKAPFPQS